MSWICFSSAFWSLGRLSISSFMSLGSSVGGLFFGTRPARTSRQSGICSSSTTDGMMIIRPPGWTGTPLAGSNCFHLTALFGGWAGVKSAVKPATATAKRVKAQHRAMNGPPAARPPWVGRSTLQSIPAGQRAARKGSPLPSGIPPNRVVCCGIQRFDETDRPLAGYSYCKGSVTRPEMGDGPVVPRPETDRPAPGAGGGRGRPRRGHRPDRGRQPDRHSGAGPVGLAGSARRPGQRGEGRPGRENDRSLGRLAGRNPFTLLPGQDGRGRRRRVVVPFVDAKIVEP